MDCQLLAYTATIALGATHNGKDGLSIPYGSYPITD